jgi:hypothetical protein
MSEAISNKELINVMGLSTLLFYVSLKKLKTRIPTHAKRPMMILLPPSLSFLSLTLEQNTPTKMTLSKLQLFTITTAGNEAYTTAWLYVNILKLTTRPQTIALVQGIGRDYVASFELPDVEQGLIMYLYPSPMMVANSCGNIVKMIAS